MLPENLAIEINKAIMGALNGVTWQTKIALGLSADEARYVRIIVIPDNFEKLGDEVKCGPQD